MALRMAPRNSRNPADRYAPAYDIANFFPHACKAGLFALKEENWPAWLREGAAPERDFDNVTPEMLHGAYLLYLRAVGLMQTDPDVDTLDKAYAMTGFDKVDPLARALVMAALMDKVSEVFLNAIRDATVLVPGGTPTRPDVADMLAAAEGGP